MPVSPRPAECPGLPNEEVEYDYGEGKLAPAPRFNVPAPLPGKGSASMPYRCPVCNGSGLVPAGFYELVKDAAGPPDKCRTCHNTGIVWRTWYSNGS